MKIAVFILSLIFSVSALGDTISGNFTYPTTNTNGTTIPASGAGSLNRAAVEYSLCNGALFGTKIGEVVVTPPVNTYVTPDLAPGNYCLRAYVTNTYGTNSAFSNLATKTNSPPTPGAPTLFVSNPTAYSIQKKDNGFVPVPVGTVPVGSPTIAGQTVNGYCVVDRDLVDWSGLSRPRVVVASCS